MAYASNDSRSRRRHWSRYSSSASRRAKPSSGRRPHMSRMLPVLKREFTQAVTSRAFLVGTILGPLLLVGVFAIQFLIIAKSGASTQRVTIVDATGRGMGDRVVAMLRERQKSTPSFIARATYTLTQEQAA